MLESIFIIESKIHCDHDYGDASRLVKPRLLKKSHRCSLTSLIIPILLGLVFIFGCILLILTLDRLNICQLQQLEQTESLQGYRIDSHSHKKHLLQNTWVDNFSHQFEHSLTDTNTDERLFLTPDRRAGIAIRIESHVPCRMSSLCSNDSVKNGLVHKCPSSSIVAPYLFGVACHDILVLWKCTSQISVRQQEDWAIVRHNYESTTPHLCILMDLFHHYYSLYPNSKIKIKDLSGHVLGKFFTDIEQVTRFEFLDHYGTLWVANTTHAIIPFNKLSNMAGFLEHLV
ncbi:unnamed protein product [Rotaria socialis]|uniref:Uncharacterized protein n=2 Tax=Rotaria socialis TaxID=392032 RepID=A0A820PD78_9BILA|nr:unnamed protein product [Rotaria socialis]